MKQIALSTLESRIIRPGFEAHLSPLLRFKGHQTLGRVHRLWNLMVSAMLHDATDSDITQRLVHSEQYSQLCGPERQISHSTLRSFTGRLLACPKVLAEEPLLREYILDILPPWKGPIWLTPIPGPPDGFIVGVERRSVAWAARQYGVGYEVCERWFRELGLVSTRHQKRRPDSFTEAARGKSLRWALEKYDVGYGVARRWFAEVGVKPEPSPAFSPKLAYPFLIHDGGKPEHALLRKVNAAVPSGLEPSLRADMCQDLLVAILSGELGENDILLPTRELSKRIWASAPVRYGERSLDEAISDDFTLMDTLADEGRDWA